MIMHRINKYFSLSLALSLVLIVLPISAEMDEDALSPVPDAKVSRAQFTSGISDREPIDRLVRVDSSINSLFYFTELLNLQGRTVSHRWEHNGEVISSVSFMVEGPRWRVFSKKNLDSSRYGKWTVFVVDESGWPIHASIFEYSGDIESLE
jgi:hypothetical protein